MIEPPTRVKEEDPYEGYPEEIRDYFEALDRAFDDRPQPQAPPTASLVRRTWFQRLWRKR